MYCLVCVVFCRCGSSCGFFVYFFFRGVRDWLCFDFFVFFGLSI